MKRLWIAGVVAVASTSALAQTTIYKHVDASGRVTYTNKPMKDAQVVELEPLTLIPSSPNGVLQVQRPGVATPPPATVAAQSAASAVSPASSAQDSSPNLKPAVAIVTALPTASAISFPKIEASTQKKRDEERRRILDEELDREEQQLANVRKNMIEEQQNPELIAAVRLAQQTADPTPMQQLELRQKLDKASGRIRGLQSTVAEHEKNIEALKKELGALKP
jgi:hypothetical protein